MQHTDRGVRFSATILVLSLMLAGFAFGQGIVTGSISGTVQDVNKAVIPDATVKAVQTATNATFTTKTDSQGFFMLKSLPIGVYTVSIEAAKFARLQLNGIDVDSGRNIGLPMQTMQVGSASEVVNVEAATPLVETTTAQIGANFDTKAVSSLPNQGAGFDNLVLYVPGVAQNASANFSNTNGASIANNGLRGRSNNFQIDGQGNNDNSVAGPSIFLSNPDIVAELQVVTNNFGAEYGRNTGSVVNYVTKSGTNAFHGSGFEYNTGNWSFSHANQEKNPIQGFCQPGQSAATDGCTAPVVPRYVENRWGGTLGGPIVKNKAWFFGSYQNDRQRGSSTGTSSSITPTPDGLAQLAATFSGNSQVTALQKIGPYGVKVGNPTPVQSTLTKLDISDGTKTASQVPFAAVTRSVASPFDDTQVTGRGDWQISDKDRFFARYIYQKSLTALGSGTISSGAFVAVPAKDQQIGLDYTRTWSQRFLQQYRFSFSRALFQFAGGEAFPDCTISDVTACPTNIAFSDSVNSFTTMGLATNLPQDRLINNTQFDNNSTYNLGRHTIKFGGEYARQRSPNHFLPNINGGYTFFSQAANAKLGFPAIDAFSMFIRGGVGSDPKATNSNLNLAQGTFTFNFKEQDVSYYGQDDWRIKDNLTVNLGLRWEWNQQAVNLLHNLTVQNVANGFWSASAPSAVTLLPNIPQDLNNYGPNVGFAYTPRILKSIFGEDKTVIRGGYRIAYDPAFYNIFSNMATAAPVVNLGSIPNVGVPGSGVGSGVQTAFFPSIPTGADPGLRNQTRVSDNFHNPYTQQWSFGFERTVNSKIAFESRYVGNHTVGNFTTINGNPQLSSFPTSLLPPGVKPCTNAPAKDVRLGREDCEFTNLRVRTNGAFSIYHGLQTQVNVRNWHNFSGNVAYTWSKAIDNVSEIFATTTLGTSGGISTPISQSPFDPTVGERGVAAQSFPHVFTSFWTYDVPFFRDQHGVLGKMLGGFQLSGTYRYQTGAPITPFQNVVNPACDTGFNNAFIGVDSCRPILSNQDAPFDQVGRYISVNGTPQLINISNCGSTLASALGTSLCPFTTPSSVHFIQNDATADSLLCGGNPFACATSRNTTRSMPRNQLDASIKKSFKVGERVSLQLQGDAFNLTNYMFLGTPGLNINSRNLTGISSKLVNGTRVATPSPSTFGNTAFNTSNRRFMQLGAHITF